MLAVSLRFSPEQESRAYSDSNKNDNDMTNKVLWNIHDAGEGRYYSHDADTER